MADLSHVAVIFDLDGTLADTAPDIHATANRVMAGLGFGPLPFAQVQSYVGRGLPHLVACLLKAHRADPQGPHLTPSIARFEAEYLTAHDLTRAYPGVVEALESLQAQGAALGVCTNKPHAPAMALLGHLNLTRFLGAVIGGDSLPRRKPDPLPLQETARQLARPKVIFVGDSEIDAETATAAALPFLLFTEGYRKSPVPEIAHSAAFADYAQLSKLIQDSLTP